MKVTSNYDELAKTPDLPENLHIIQEYNRFDPATDKLHGGVTAYPGANFVKNLVINFTVAVA